MRILWNRLIIFIKDSFTKETNKVCPTCKTGAYYFKLDTDEWICPLIECHRGSYCSAYEPLLTEHKSGERNNYGRNRPYIKPEVMICNIGNYESNILKFQIM